MTTDAEIDAAIAKGRAFDRDATKIVRATYDRERDQINALLSTDATISVPRKRLPRFDVYRPGDFGPVRIEPPGYGIWFDKPDIGLRIEDLLRAASGEDLLRSVAAQIMASAGTENKAQEAHNNRLHGGRPAKRATRSSGPPAGTGTISIKRPNPTNMAPTSVKFKGDTGSQRAQQAVVRGEPPGPTKGASYKIVQPAKNKAGNK